MSVHIAPADSTAADQAALAPLVARAQAAARAEGRPVLVSYAEPLHCEDPLALLQALEGEAAPGWPAPAGNGDAPEPARPFRFYWEQPSAGLALAAGGVAQSITAHGAARFREVATRVEAALRSAVIGGTAPDDPGPYVLGGFSFFDRLDEAQWPGFQAAQMVVPRWLAVRQGRSCLAMVTALVDALGSAQAVAAHLAAGLRRMRCAAGALAAHDAEAAPEAPGEEDARAFHPVTAGDDRAAWIDVVRKARANIRSGRLSKVVLARTLDLVCEAAPSALRLLQWLRSAYAGCYSFLVDPGSGSVFLGATPERIARFQRGRVQLAALAGTMPRGDTPEADAGYAQRLMDCPKERSEHQIVVDSIVQAVRPLGTVEWAPEPQVLKFPNVQHLYTPIELVPHEPVGMLGLLEHLHPTAAVGGFPKAEASAMIRDCEGFERGWYAAPVGWMNARGDGEFAAALRSGRLSGHDLRLFAGGGIVADSDPEREFEETQIKLQPLLSALAAR